MAIPVADFPLHIMRKDSLNAFSFQVPNPLHRSLGFLEISMDATRMALGILPLSDISFVTHDAAIVAGIAGKVDPFGVTLVLAGPCKKVDVAGKVTGGIDDVKTTISKDIQG